MGFFSKSISILGVDIGTTDLKIAQITHTTQAKTLDTYGIVTLKDKLGGLEDSQAVETTANILGELIKHARATADRCVISLPSSAVFTTVIETPVVDEEELAKTINYEAKKYIPLDLNEVIISWSVVSKPSSVSGTQSVLLTAVPKQIRERYVQLFNLLNLNLEVIEIEALALIRSLLNTEDHLKNNCVIIDIGAKTTTINLVKSGFLQFSRSVNVGGDTATNKLAEVLGITQARAEQFKHDYAASAANLMPDAVKPVLNIIKNEVRQMLAIYQAKGTTTEKLLFIGGGSNMPGLQTFFKDLNVPITFGNPIQHLTYPKALETVIQREAKRLAVAIGLALRT